MHQRPSHLLGDRPSIRTSRMPGPSSVGGMAALGLQPDLLLGAGLSSAQAGHGFVPPSLGKNSGTWRQWSELKSAALGERVLLCLAGPPQGFRRKPKGRAAANGDPETSKLLL